MIESRSILPLVFATAILVSGCTAGQMTPRETGAVGGAVFGAGTGAIIGSTSGDAAEGALIGGAIGAIAGAIIGDSEQARQQRMQRDQALAAEMQGRNLDATAGDRGVVVNFSDVLFEFGRSELTRGADRKVQEIADVLRSPDVAWRGVAIEGHTDSVGGEQANVRLSDQRARSVAAALSSLGVDPSRLTVQGFGEGYPVAPNTRNDGRDNPEGRARNRRVEIVILNEQGAAVQPAPAQPVYQQPLVQQPVYSQPGYPQQPVYPQPGYPQQPGYGYPPPPSYPVYPQGPPPYGY